MKRHIFYYYILKDALFEFFFKNVFGCCVDNIFPSIFLSTKFERQILNWCEVSNFDGKDSLQA